MPCSIICFRLGIKKSNSSEKLLGKQPNIDEEIDFLTIGAAVPYF
jgi:hypothetical protein